MMMMDEMEKKRERIFIHHCQVVPLIVSAAELVRIVLQTRTASFS